jgi:hypothetical protein
LRSCFVLLLMLPVDSGTPGQPSAVKSTTSPKQTVFSSVNGSYGTNASCGCGHLKHSRIYNSV